MFLQGQRELAKQHRNSRVSHHYTPHLSQAGIMRFFCSLLPPKNPHVLPCCTNCVPPAPRAPDHTTDFKDVGRSQQDVGATSPAVLHLLLGTDALLIPKDTSRGRKGDGGDVLSAVRSTDGGERQIRTTLTQLHTQWGLTCHSLSSSRYLCTALSSPSTDVPPPSLSSAGSTYCEGG